MTALSTVEADVELEAVVEIDEEDDDDEEGEEAAMEEDISPIMFNRCITSGKCMGYI